MTFAILQYDSTDGFIIDVPLVQTADKTAKLVTVKCQWQKWVERLSHASQGMHCTSAIDNTNCPGAGHVRRLSEAGKK